MRYFFCGLACALACLGYAEDSSGFIDNGVTAHRGNSGEFPENTMPAFESALALGADWIELDIYLSKDGQVVVCHDTDTARMGDKKLSVTNSTFAELLTVDVATGFRTRKKLSVEQCPPLRMPLLEDVIKLVMRQNRTRLSLQPKDECVEAAFKIIRRLKAERWIGFNDGNLRKMRQVKSLDRKVPVFWDRPAQIDTAKDIQIALQSGFESMVVRDLGLTKDMVERIHKAGLEPGVWTVNSEAGLQRFLDMGVRRIYTDYPELLLRLKQEQRGR
ncbi:MAG: glycerophosphodiester phosphodiesterase family protein [Kiritimatiellae bacterium]|nr:glycerophosphodiester phosphodiesterase family protein [Kiritimatiellia bacterium]